MKEQQFRNKITWFAFGFSLFVVWVHSYNAELYLGKTAEAEAVYRFQHWIGDGIGQAAVPGFFMISAYLFYRNFSWGKLVPKWTSRIRSVLVPFIVWNFIYYLGYVIGSRLPWMTDVVGKGVIPFTLPAAVDAVINYTYNYVFWYLYQLILLILLAPVLYGVLRHKALGIVFQAVIWILLAAGVNLPELNLDALAYYSLAAFLAIHGSGSVEAAWNWRRGIAGGVMLIGSVAAFRYGLRVAEPVFFVLSRVLAVAGLWSLIPEGLLSDPKRFMDSNFFLYATHFAFVRFINKAGTEVLPAVPVVPVVLYLVMPMLVLGISSAIGCVLRRWAPWVWELLNGGR